MIENIKNYIKDIEFRLTIYFDKIHIVNYSKIISLENDRISLLGGDKKIVITGNNLVLSKLLDDEILIVGELLTLEVLHD